MMSLGSNLSAWIWRSWSRRLLPRYSSISDLQQGMPSRLVISLSSSASCVSAVSFSRFATDAILFEPRSSRLRLRHAPSPPICVMRLSSRQSSSSLVQSPKPSMTVMSLSHSERRRRHTSPSSACMRRMRRCSSTSSSTDASQPVSSSQFGAVDTISDTSRRRMTAPSRTRARLSAAPLSLARAWSAALMRRWSNSSSFGRRRSTRP
mmetsp:Transcript_224/g.594  ORF Transcript_224/g.594 Transcript_224/m.594 type:complete len:207 (-) Transcript_224:395-1015(-)